MTMVNSGLKGLIPSNMPNNVMAQVSTTSDVYIIDNLLTLPPIRHETLTQCWCDVGPPSATLAQHEANTGQCLMFRFHPRDPRHRRQSRDTGGGQRGNLDNYHYYSRLV